MDILNKTRLLQTSFLTGLLFSMGTVAYAQTTDDDAAVEQVPQQEEVVDEDGDEIVVTGTRLKKDTFSSISPIQTISTEISQDAGLFDPATILQTSEAATGQQIDATFNGFVLDNGPRFSDSEPSWSWCLAKPYSYQWPPGRTCRCRGRSC